MSTRIAAKLAIAAAFLSLALVPTLPAQAITFGDGKYLEKLYDGCATERDLFQFVRNYGAKPKSITSVAPGVVLIRGKDRDRKTYDFAVVPCLHMVDGRFLVK